MTDFEGFDDLAGQLEQLRANCEEAGSLIELALDQATQMTIQRVNQTTATSVSPFA